MSKAPHQETLKRLDTDAPTSQQPPKRVESDPAAAPLDQFEEIDYNMGRFHGLTEAQIKRIEEARYDDSEGVPPPVQGPPPIYDPMEAQAANEAELQRTEDERKAMEAHDAELLQERQRAIAEHEAALNEADVKKEKQRSAKHE
jgi:hypothetical protein